MVQRGDAASGFNATQIRAHKAPTGFLELTSSSQLYGFVSHILPESSRPRECVAHSASPLPSML